MQEQTSFRIGGLLLSAIMCRPPPKPRAIIMAIHGGGYRASYWHHPDHSLLTRAANRGMLGIAVDRPGYGTSERVNMALAEQANVIFDLVDELKAREDGIPLLVAGHSMGAILALMMAATARSRVLAAVDASGVPFLYPEAMKQALAARTPAPSQTHYDPLDRGHVRAAFYGPDGSFAPRMLDYDAGLAAPIPVAELTDATRAPERLPDILPRIACPVRLTFAEFEQSSLVNDHVLAFARQALAASPGSQVRVEANTGHNVSLHHGGGRFHDAMLDWFEAGLAIPR